MLVKRANLKGKEHDDYSERAIEYIGEVKEKYPNAEIVVDGQSMAGKIAIQNGLNEQITVE